MQEGSSKMPVKLFENHAAI